MNDDLSQRLVASAERMVDYNDRLFEIFQRIGNESKSRIIWLVAIAGFAIVNIPTLSAHSTLNWASSLAPAAWVFTALLGAITHWQFRNRSIAEVLTYIAKRELLLAYIANGPGSATMSELNEILAHKKEPLPKHFKSQQSTTTFADRMEFATMIAFALSMALTIRAYIFP
jgi:hypothetical protein